MILRPCPFCSKEIPRAIQVCPYCHRDEKGQAVVMDSAVQTPLLDDKYFDDSFQELASDDPFIRDQAVVDIAQKGFGVVQALISILSDFAKPGLAGVAAALGKIGDRRAIPVLSQAAKMGDEDLRIAAVWALAQFHEPEVLPVLISEADRSHPVIQSFIAHALGTFQDSRAVSVLQKLADHPNREVVFQAACALAETGDRNGIPTLRKIWRRRDPLVRSASAAALRRLGSSPSMFSPLLLSIGFVGLALLGTIVGWFFYK